MVTTIGRAWVRQDNDPRPLQARWAETSEQLVKLGGSPVVPASEISIQEMQSTIRDIERKRMAAAVPDDRLVAAKAEFRDACHRYRHAHTAIVETQEKLRRRANDPVYGLLFDMTAALRAPVGPQDMLDNTFGGCRECSDLYYLRFPEFASVSNYRSAMNTVSDLARDLEGQHDVISTVSSFPSMEIGARVDKMIAALVRRISELERLAVLLFHSQQAPKTLLASSVG
jgi:hypothetical protein